MWRHRSRDHLLPHISFPVGGLCNGIPISPAVFDILRSKRIGVTSLTLQNHVTSSITLPFDSPYAISYWWPFGTKPLSLMPNTHRWRRRDSTVELSRVGVASESAVCWVESSWVVSVVCTHPSTVVTQFAILQPICDWRRKLETGSRLTTLAYTPPTRLNSTVESRRRRRCVLSITVSKIFNVECNAMVDVTLIRPLNKGQGHSFWYQSISHIRLHTGSQL